MEKKFDLLSKEQMNHICGGAWFSCSVDGQWVAFVKAATKEAAEKSLYGSYGSSVTCVATDTLIDKPKL